MTVRAYWFLIQSQEYASIHLRQKYRLLVAVMEEQLLVVK